MAAASKSVTRPPVLIVGGGPVGLGLAADLGWRGVACTVVEQGDGSIAHPRATAENARTMELFRRWGIAERVKEAGTPPDFPHTVLYLTSLTGYEIARIDRPGHGGAARTAISPERPQRCNQLWLDPILRDFATSFPTVTLKLRTRFELFVEKDGGIVATVTDLASGETHTIEAGYLVACCGGASSIQKTLGIAMNGVPALDYNLNIFFRVKELWNYHDKGKGALHFFADAQGIWRTLVQIDGRELWRLGIRGQWHYENPDKVDASAMINEMVGREIPHEVVASLPWVARDLVADLYGKGRVLLAGDAAHQNTPSGGFGLNTGMGDVNDLGWKLAGLAQGWGGPRLIDSDEAERRPVPPRVSSSRRPIISCATASGRRIRRSRWTRPPVPKREAQMGAAILESQIEGLSHRRHRARAGLRQFADRLRRRHAAA